jgi:predicted dehydrogenase
MNRQIELGDQPWRVLVMGCGSIGKRHISNLLSLGIRPLVVYDIHKERTQEIETLYSLPTTNTLDSTWELQPNVALICAPSSLHIPLAIEAANHGCHLFIEKPLGDSLAGIDELLQLVAKNHLFTLVGCNMRFHPALLLIQSLLESRTIGRVISMQVEVGKYLPDWHPQEDYRKNYSAQKKMGGGIILDAIHELDYIRWLLGEVKSIVCFADHLSHLEIDTEDTAAILLRFANQEIGEVHLDYVQRSSNRSCRVIGDEGTIVWTSASGKVSWYTAASQQWQEQVLAPDWRTNQMYLDELIHFFHCLKEQKKTMQDVEEGKRVLEIALAAKQSAIQDRVIRFSEV